MWLGPKCQTDYMFFFISDCCSYMSQENYRIEELCFDRFNIWNPSIILVWSGNTVLVSSCSLLLLCAEHKTSSSNHPAHDIFFFKVNLSALLRVFEISSVQNTLNPACNTKWLLCDTYLLWSVLLRYKRVL